MLRFSILASWTTVWFYQYSCFIWFFFIFFLGIILVLCFPDVYNLLCKVLLSCLCLALYLCLSKLGLPFTLLVVTLLWLLLVLYFEGLFSIMSRFSFTSCLFSLTVFTCCLSCSAASHFIPTLNHCVCVCV